MWCMHCGQDVPWNTSTTDGRLVCSRCGQVSAEGAEVQPLPPTGHVPLNLPINSVHKAHPVGASGHTTSGASESESKVSISGDPLDVSNWPVSSAYDGWRLDEQLTHIREVLDSLSGSESSSSDVRLDTATTEADSELERELPKIDYRIDALHRRQRGFHRRKKKRSSFMGRFLFGLVFFVIGTGMLVLSVASILPREIWLPGDLPIAGVLLQVLGAFLFGLGISGLAHRFHEALQQQATNRRHRRFDEPQMGRHAPHVDVKVRS